MSVNRPVLWLPLVVWALVLVPAQRTAAQAGLSGNALGGQMEEMRAAASSWDQGLKSRSALGQLEEMTGTKVDRSSTANQSRASTSRSSLSSKQSFNRAMNAAMADALSDVLISALFSDNGAAKAQAEAKARAEAEAQAAAAAAAAQAARVAEEARQARIKMAGDLRSFRDAQDRTMEGNLSGAFDVTVTTGTSFFAEPANPDADAVARLLSAVGAPEGAEDQATGHLPDNPHLAVDPVVFGQPFGGAGLTPGTIDPDLLSNPAAFEADAGFRMPELMPRTAAEEAALHAAGWYADTMQNAVKDSLWSLAFGRWLAKLNSLPGMETAKAFLEFREKFEELSDPMRTKIGQFQTLLATGSQDAARILGSSRVSDGGYSDRYLAAVEELGGETAREARGLAFGEVAGRTVRGPEFGPGGDEDAEFSFIRPLNGITRGRYGHLRIDP